MTGRWRLAVRRGDGRAVSAFLAIAFGLAWLPFLAQATGAGAVGPVLMPVAPAVACIVVRRWVSREGFRDAGLRWRPRPQHWPVYVLVLLWPVAATVCSTGVALALGRGGPGFSWPWGAAAPSVVDARDVGRPERPDRAGRPRARSWAGGDISSCGCSRAAR